MKKLLALILALVMVLSMAACTGNPEESKGNNDESTVDIGNIFNTEDSIDKSLYQVTEEVEVLFWHSFSDSTRSEWLQKKADEFMAKNPLIKIDVQYIGNYKTIATQIAGCIAADGQGLPAMSIMNAARILSFASTGVTEPLNNYVIANDDVDEFGDFYDGMIDANVYEEDGQVYALPFSISTFLFFCNKTVLGDDLMPETWEEFKTWAVRIHDKTGKVACGFSTEQNNMYHLIMSVTGIDPLNDGVTSALDDERVVKVVKELKELIDAGAVAMVDGEDDLRLNFQAGEYLSYYSTTNNTTTAYECTKELGFEMATAVGFHGEGVEKPAYTVSGANLVIYEDNDQQVKNAAYLFAMYLCNAENNADWATQTLALPSHKSAVEKGLLNELFTKYPAIKDTFPALGEGMVSKHKSPALNDALKVITQYSYQYFKGGFSEEEFDSQWALCKKEVDALLADVQ